MMFATAAGLCIVICAFGGVQALVGSTCTSETECDKGECCQILSEFMVVSKRDDAIRLPVPTDISISLPKKTGTCQKYKVEGQGCSSFAKMNGYCGCGPGLYCHTFERQLPTASLVLTHVLRSMLAPRPGYEWVSQCDKVSTP